MLWTLVVIILVLWLIGAFVVPVGGALIHLLLLVALVIGLIQLFSGRRVV